MWKRITGDFWILPVVIVFIFIIYKSRNYFRIIRLIFQLDGPPSIPVIGNTGFLYDEDLLHKLAHVAYPTYGTLFRIWVTLQPFVVILEPDDIQQILSSPKHTEKPFFYSLLHNFLGRGLLTSDATIWKLHRKIIQPIFHINVLEEFVKAFNRSANDLTTAFSDAESVDGGVNISRMVNSAIYATLSETVLGKTKETDSSSDSTFRKGQVHFSHRLNRPWLLFDWIYQRTNDGKRELEYKHELATACKSHIKIKESMSNDDHSKKTTSLLEMMMALREKHHNFSDEDVVNECCTFMLAGQDSVGAATAMTIFMLAKHKQWQEKCVEELEEIFGSDQREPTFGDLREMRCLEMCIKETMRLYPPVPFFGRIVGEDIKIGDKVIPKGCGVLIMPYSTHRLPHHFSNPHEFDPENFSPEYSGKRHPYAYFPFSAGPRNCIGYKFALLEMKSIISAVLRKYHLDLVPGKEEITPKFRVTVRVKGGIWIKLHPRNSPTFNQ